MPEHLGGMTEQGQASPDLVTLNGHIYVPSALWLLRFMSGTKAISGLPTTRPP